MRTVKKREYIYFFKFETEILGTKCSQIGKEIK